MDFFGSPLKTFPLVIAILAAIELIEKMEGIKKNIRTWDCGTSRYGALKDGGGGGEVTKTHCYATLFSIKRLFCKTNNIFYSL